ncbi:MurR/RpiR family transcriptional regulator [Frateuria aurantia]
MDKALQKKLKDHWDGFTASEQKIAAYLLRHLHDLPFETAASLSKHVGVSPMTVGRFLRTLGYDGVAELKEELRGGGTWKQLYRSLERPVEGDAVADHLQTEIRALNGVHALVSTPEWVSVQQLLTSANRVSIASFQHAAFLGLALANLLLQLRPGVSFHPGNDGAYVDMLLDSGPDSCIVLIDVRRYFKQFRTLATEIVERGIPLVLITDSDCYWARELTPHVLMLEVSTIWHSYSALSSLFSLLTASLMQQPGAMQRLGEINALRQKLVGYVGSRASTEPEPARRPGADPRAANRRRRRSDPR